MTGPSAQPAPLPELSTVLMCAAVRYHVSGNSGEASASLAEMSAPELEQTVLTLSWLLQQARRLRDARSASAQLATTTAPEVTAQA